MEQTNEWFKLHVLMTYKINRQFNTCTNLSSVRNRICSFLFFLISHFLSITFGRRSFSKKNPLPKKHTKQRRWRKVMKLCPRLVPSRHLFIFHLTRENPSHKSQGSDWVRVWLCPALHI